MKIFLEPREVGKINTVHAVEPLSSTDFTLSLKQVKNAVAFDVPVGDKKVCPPARISRRFRKQKVAPERTLGDVKEKLRAAEERRLKELQRIREIARMSSGLEVSKPYPHSAETFAQATAAKIAAKQAAAEKRRNEELEKKKQAGKKASRNRSRIVAAQSSIKRKVDETEKRQENSQQTIDRQYKLREEHYTKVKDKVSINCELQLSMTTQFFQ